MAKLKMLSPWVVFYREVDAMFKQDEDVKVIYDEEAQSLKIFVDNTSKADALSQILPQEKGFGNVTLMIEVIPANYILQTSKEDLFRRAFLGNSAVVFVETTKEMPGFPPVTHIVFTKTVVQYFTDNLFDYYGVTSTLYQDIAKDIFINTEGVYFSTDVNENWHPTPSYIRPASAF